MPTVANCPECREPMNLSDAAVGRRVRCPGCKHIFVAPGGEEEAEVVECAVAEAPVKRPVPRLSLDDEEEDRPRRKARLDDEEDEDEDDRPRRKGRRDEEDRPAKRRRKRDVSQEAASSAPIILGILSCVFCCIPIVGGILGGIARNKAEEEMNRLPGGKRFASAHQQMRTAHLLGTIGITLSCILMVLGIILKILQMTRTIPR